MFQKIYLKSRDKIYTLQKNRSLSYPNAFQISLAESPADPLPTALWDGSLHALPQLGLYHRGQTSQLLEPLATIHVSA